MGIVVAERSPEPGGLDQQLEAYFLLEALVAGGVLIAHDAIGDVGPEVERGGAGGPVARAFLAPDSAPRERRALEPQLSGPGLGSVEGAVPPPQSVAGGAGHRVGQHGQNERLRVPEGVSVVPRPGEPLGGDGSLFGARSGLEHVEEGEPHGLLQLCVALELYVGASPEVVEVGALGSEKVVPAGVTRSRQGRLDLAFHRRERTPARPAVGQELDQPQDLSGLELGGDSDPSAVGTALPAGLGFRRPIDDVVHARGHEQTALPGRMHEHGPGVAVEVVLRLQR